MQSNNTPRYTVFHGHENCTEGGVFGLFNQNHENSIVALSLVKYFNTIQPFGDDFCAGNGHFIQCGQCGALMSDLTKVICNPVFSAHSGSEYQRGPTESDAPYISRIKMLDNNEIRFKDSLAAVPGVKRLKYLDNATVDKSERLKKAVNYVGSIICTYRGHSPDVGIEECTSRYGPKFKDKKAITLYFRTGCLHHTLNDYDGFVGIACSKANSTIERHIYKDVITLLFYEHLNELFHSMFFFPLIAAEKERFRLRNPMENPANFRFTLPEETIIEWSRWVVGLLLYRSNVNFSKAFEDDLCPDYLLNIDGTNVIKWALR